MNRFAERLVDGDLREVLGRRRAPDLTAAILAALRQPAHESAAPPAQAAVYRLQRRWVRWLEAACIVAAFGVMGWLLWPGGKNTDLPAGVKASPGASFAVSGAAIKLDRGWLLLDENSPTVMVGDGRVDRIRGKLVVKTGAVPDANELSELRSQLHSNLSDKEKTMLMDTKRWLSAGAMAVCLFNGSATVNGQEARPIYVPDPKVDQKCTPTVDDNGRWVAPKPSADFSVANTYNGDDSDIAEREYQLILNQKELETVLLRHRTEGWDKLPVNADFNKEMVIAVFLGRCDNTPEVTAKGTFKSNERYILRYQAPPYQTSGDSKKTTPFAFFVVTRTAVRVALEELVITRMGDVPRWERRHEFDQGAGAVPGLLKDEAVAKEHTSDTTERKFHSVTGPRVTQANWRLVKNATDFDTLWTEHAPNTAKPWEVDFDKHVVLAVFCPRTMNSRGLKLEDTLVNADTRVLRLNNDVDVYRSAASFSTPCAFYLLPKDERTLVVELKNHYKLDKGGWVTRSPEDPEQWVEEDAGQNE